MNIVRSVYEGSLKTEEYDVMIKAKKLMSWHFPGGPVVNSPPCNAGDMDLSPSWGTVIPHTTEQRSPNALEPTHQNWRFYALQLESLCTATKDLA